MYHIWLSFSLIVQHLLLSVTVQSIYQNLSSVVDVSAKSNTTLDYFHQKCDRYSHFNVVARVCVCVCVCYFHGLCVIIINYYVHYYCHLKLIFFQIIIMTYISIGGNCGLRTCLILAPGWDGLKGACEP